MYQVVDYRRWAANSVRAYISKFIKMLNKSKIDEHRDELRKFTDLSEILLGLRDKRHSGNSATAKNAKKSYVKVTKMQIQSLYGIV